MVTATLPVCERGGTVQREVTHVRSEYRGCSHTSGFERSRRNLTSDHHQVDLDFDAHGSRRGDVLDHDAANLSAR